MDLERIKQNFRIRLGRARKQKKPLKPQSTPLPPQNTDQKSSKAPKAEASRSNPTTAKREDKHETAKNQYNLEERKRRPQKVNEAERVTRSQPEPKSPVGKKEEPVTPVKKTEERIVATDALTEPRTSPPHAVASSSSTHLSRRDSLGSEDSSLDLPTSKLSHTMTDTQFSIDLTTSDGEDFDLAPPKPRPKPISIESLAELLFSSEHLDALLHHPPQLARFSAFLQKYIPQSYPLLAQYLETRKAIKAIEYANAIAEGLGPKEIEGSSATCTSFAARLDPVFEAICNSSFEALVGDALPSFVSYNLVKTVSECLINEITGRSTPVMRDLMNGLSEVFCLTDPNQEDNPIIYASEEFYRLTRYGPEDVINNNCRFLQGRKTNPNSPKRLSRAIQNGEAISETLLNYRRDGRPFINLLMIAPLYDKYGKLRYHIGAQVDVSRLVEGGRALDGFQRCLARRSGHQKREAAEMAEKNLDDEQRRKQRALARLRDLSETFDLEETAVVQAASRPGLLTHDPDENASMASLPQQKGQRRVYVNSESSECRNDGALDENQDSGEWKLGEGGNGRLSRRLPGVYDSFMLFRPTSSFRIVFVSPKLRQLGNVIQTPFLSHVAAPTGTLNGLSESLRAGVPVSAKIHFMPERGERRDGTKLKSGTKHEDGKSGRAVWVSCTPLLGEDERIGVWMCVVVEKSKIGSIGRGRDAESEKLADEAVKHLEGGSVAGTSSYGRREDRLRWTETPDSPKVQRPNVGTDVCHSRREDIPIKPVRVDSQMVIKPQTEESPESARTGDEVPSNTVHLRQSIYFDAEQGGDNDGEHSPDHQGANEPGSDSLPPANGHDSPTPMRIQQRDSRAVVTPVEEYEEPVRKPEMCSVETPRVSSSLHNFDEDAGDYITTRSPIMPSHQMNGRILIEEDSDVLQDSDLDHHRENMKIGQKRGRPTTPRSLDSPVRDGSRSTPSVHAMAEDGGFYLEEETPTRTRYDQSASRPDVGSREHADDLAQSYATIRPARKHSGDQDSDRDSAISLNSPDQPKTKSRSRSSRGKMSLQRSASGKQYDSDYEEQQQEDEVQIHKRDVETWVAEGRPPSSRHNSRMRMDYFGAGSSRWQRLPTQRLDTAFEKEYAHGEDDDDDMTSFGHCARSPYSVD